MESPLKKARIEAGYSLEEVARQINIRKQYLKALEEGRETDLPGKVYAQGYFKIYAAHLNLPIDYDNNDIELKINADKRSESKINKNTNFVIVLIAFAALILLQIIYKNFIC